MRLFNLNPYQFKVQLINAAGGSLMQFICQAFFRSLTVPVPVSVPVSMVFGTICSSLFGLLIEGYCIPGFSIGACLFNLATAATAAQVITISESSEQNFNQVYTYLTIIAAAACYTKAKYTHVPEQQNEDGWMRWVRQF